MSEKISNTPIENESLSENQQTILIHNQSLKLDSKRVLRSLDESREQAMNGQVVAEIEIPSKVHGLDIDKTIAIMDYGEDIPEKGRAILYNPSVNKELDNLGVTRSRYGLITQNYKPEELIAGFVVLKADQIVTIGRNKEDRNNYLLGLLDMRDDNSHLSREHFSIHIDKDNNISIEDHSTNGTKVVIPK